MRRRHDSRRLQSAVFRLATARVVDRALNLNRSMADVEAVMQVITGLTKQGVVVFQFWPDQVCGQSKFRRTHRPDMQVMDLAYAL